MATLVPCWKDNWMAIFWQHTKMGQHAGEHRCTIHLHWGQGMSHCSCHSLTMGPSRAGAACSHLSWALTTQGQGKTGLLTTWRRRCLWAWAQPAACQWWAVRGMPSSRGTVLWWHVWPWWGCCTYQAWKQQRRGWGGPGWWTWWGSSQGMHHTCCMGLQGVCVHWQGHSRWTWCLWACLL